MADMGDVVVLSAVRSAIGAFNGALKDMEPADLGGLVIKEAIARAGVDPEQVTSVRSKPSAAATRRG